MLSKSVQFSKLPLRATQGYLQSLLSSLNLDLPVPNYRTLSRRLGKIVSPNLKLTKEAVRHIIIDSTSLKVYGEGEWKVRGHGYSKRRTWRKIHLGIDSSNQVIVCAVISTNEYNDRELLKDCLDQVPSNSFESLAADGAYDAIDCYDYCAKKQIKPLILPQYNAIVVNE